MKFRKDETENHPGPHSLSRRHESGIKKKGERRLETACPPLKSYEKTRAEKISVPGSFESLNGGRSPNLVEPVSEGLDFVQGWVKPRIDFAELAKLRESGMSLQKIAARLGSGRTRVYRALCSYSRKDT